MPQNLRRFYGGNDFHFLTFSCHKRQPFLINEAYADLFLQILDRVRRRYRLVILAYVVMPEHVHLLVSEPQRETLSTAIQSLKLGFVRSLGAQEIPFLAKKREMGHPNYPKSLLAGTLLRFQCLY
jgi:putative transposase